jgi:hypothetical protein
MRTQAFRQPIARPRTLGPEYNPWYWNPGNPSVRFAPESFRHQLRAVGEELDCTWDPIKQRWLVWMQSPRVNHRICRGWKLLFINQEPDGTFLPLDERVFARLYAASVFEHGSAKQYFNRIKSEMERDAARREASRIDESTEVGWDQLQHKNPWVGAGPSNGSKFSKYL